ncbi:MAG: hypothetical protein JWO13_1959 [Acidobacteriales bacterium]|nr:hypothetical protein [Terriglobales bacterium]
MSSTKAFLLGSKCVQFVACLLLLMMTSGMANAQGTASDAGFSFEKFLTFPPYRLNGLAWAPDGRAFLWQKDGVIKIYKNGAVLTTPFLDISKEINAGGDRGLIGFAFDPNFSTNGYVYVTYVYEDPAVTPRNQFNPATERLSRFQADPNNPDKALAGSETIILGKVSTPGCSGINQDCMPNDAHEHTIDRVMFASDGSMFLSLGEGGSSSGTSAHAFRAQNLDILNGKVLHITKSGQGFTSNPFYNGDVNANRSKVWDYGLRNPYSFSIKPGTVSDLYIADVGWYTWEEINRGKGKNFGWPCFEGGLNTTGQLTTVSQPRYQTDFPSNCSPVPASSTTAPIYAYNHNGGGAAVLGAIFYTGTKYPTQYQNNLFFADYNNAWIKRAVIDPTTGNITSVKTFATGVESPNNIVQGPDGNLYYVGFTTGNVWRIRYTGSLPPVAKASGTPTSGASPLTVNFSSAGSSDPNGGTLTYSWDFGDGTGTSTNANPTYTYNSATTQTFTAVLTVTNTKGLSSTAQVKITIGSTPPTATITAPANGAVYNIGDQVTYAGSATDAKDGTLSGASLQWTILLHHQDHVHTAAQTTGSGGTFTVENHDAIGYFYYEIILTATNSDGLQDTKSVSIQINRPTGNMIGNVVDARNNKGVAGVVVSYSGGSNTTDANGAYVLLNVPPGNYTLTTSKSGWLSSTANVAVTAGATTTTNIPIATAGKISGVVTNKTTGAVIPGATVKIVGGVIATSKTLTTNSSGAYATNWIPVGTYTVTASATGRTTTSVSVTIGSGQTATVNIALP